ncbi:MAG: hypothetical protein KAH23_05775 [Kiritimatiellae bacterium]|nr:hypothetical protein [Kiritimatiellia bacterium]
MRMPLKKIVALCLAVFLAEVLCFCFSGCSDAGTPSESRVEVTENAGIPSVHGGGIVDSAYDIRVRLIDLQRKHQDDSIRLGKMQNEVIKSNPELAKMEQEYLAERKIYVDKLETMPQVREKIEKRNELSKRALELAQKTRKIIENIKICEDEDKKALLQDDLAMVRKNFRNVHSDLGVMRAEVDVQKTKVRDGNRFLKSMHAKLVEKQHLLYIGKPGEVPEIAELRKVQEERTFEIKGLRYKIMTMRKAGSSKNSIAAEATAEKEPDNG